MDEKYINFERMYFPANDVKDEDDVKRERIVVILIIMVLVGLAVGLPLMVNMGKTLFEIKPIIY